MIDALQRCTKTTLTQKLNCFITISNVVTIHNFIVSIFIIISKIELQMWATLYFCNRLVTDEVNSRVLKDFCFFKLSQCTTIESDSISWRHRKRWDFLLRYFLRLKAENCAKTLSMCIYDWWVAVRSLIWVWIISNRFHHSVFQLVLFVFWIG